MTTPTSETLQHFADKTGYQDDTLEKMVRLLDILQAIAHDGFLGGRLALEGGTALNAFHLGLGRLSVDIDLSYVGALDRATMLAERPEVEAALNSVLAAQGYRVKHRPTRYSGGKWVLRFASCLGDEGKLALDVNYVARQPLIGTARMSSVMLGDTMACDVLVLDRLEVIAHKLAALFERSLSRDLFDARRVLSAGLDEDDWRLVKAAFLAFGATADFDWRSVTTDMIRGDPQELRQKLEVCLPRGHFTSGTAVKGWLDETVALCRERFAFLLDWTEAERGFLDGVLDRGEVDAGLLDAPLEVRARIAAMPWLAWKCRNVLRHGRGRDLPVRRGPTGPSAGR